MLCAETLELVNFSRTTIQSIDSLKQTLLNSLNTISLNLTHPEVLRVISNDDLQKCVDILQIGGIVVNKVYDVHIVPYARPLEFKIAMTNNANPVYQVYYKIMGIGGQSLGLFIMIYNFQESLWEENYNPELSGRVLNALITAIPLEVDEKRLFQECLDKYNMQITIN